MRYLLIETRHNVLPTISFPTICLYASSLSSLPPLVSSDDPQPARLDSYYTMRVIAASNGASGAIARATTSTPKYSSVATCEPMSVFGFTIFWWKKRILLCMRKCIKLNYFIIFYFCMCCKTNLVDWNNLLHACYQVNIYNNNIIALRYIDFKIYTISHAHERIFLNQ